MKPFFLLLLVTIAFMNISAQTNIVIRGGFNYATARAYYNDVKQSTGYVPGGNLGVQVNTVFEGILHFSPMLSYNSRGFVIKNKSNGDKTTNFIHYVDIATILSVFLKTNAGNGFIIGAGPVASLAIAGKEKNSIAGITTTSSMKFSTSTNYGLFDFGLRTSVGYRFNKLLIEAAYQHGFVSINNNEERDKRNIRNRIFSINLGYTIKSYK